MVKPNSLVLFDVKLKSPHKDVVVIKGNEAECDTIPFEGSVKLSISDDMHVRRIKMNLITELNISFTQKTSLMTYPVLERLCAMKVSWDNLLTSSEGSIRYGDYGDKFIKYHRLSSLKKSKETHSSSERPVNRRTASSPLLEGKSSSLLRVPKSGVDGTPFLNQKTSHLHSYLLPKGNYSLPFTIYLPANIPETVEAMNWGSILHKVTCTIERGRFEKSIQTAKHIRFVRTLHPGNINMTDSIDVNNSWPGKLQYNVSMPKKALALGVTVPVNIIILPLVKGLELKGIQGSLVEHVSLSHSEGIFTEVLTVEKQEMPFVTPASVDEWHISTHFRMPESLRKVTQTCTIKENALVVKHRFRIQMQLKNKEGHISEVRANLPVYVYLNPKLGPVFGAHYDVDPHNGFTEDKTKEDVIFRKDKASSDNSTSDNSRVSEGKDEDGVDEEAPPLYTKHYLDRVYDMSSPRTPIEQSGISSGWPSPESEHSSMPNLTSYFDIPKSSNEPSSGGPLLSPSITVLNAIPTYDEAAEEDSGIIADLSPRYSNGVKSIDETSPILSSFPEKKSSKSTTHLPRPKSAHLSLNRPKSTKNMIPASAPHSPTPESFSGSSSSNSSPSHSRSTSTTFKLSGLPLKVKRKEHH